MKVLFEIATIEELRIGVKPRQGMMMGPVGDYTDRELYDQEERRLGTVKELLYERWNERALPDGAGRHDEVEFVSNPVKMDFRGTLMECDVLATLIVGRERFTLELDEAQMAMLRGEGPEVEMPDPETAGVKLGADEAVEAEFTIEAVRPYA
jgi:hypothetical protein